MLQHAGLECKLAHIVFNHDAVSGTFHVDPCGGNNLQIKPEKSKVIDEPNSNSSEHLQGVLRMSQGVSQRSKGRLGSKR